MGEQVVSRSYLRDVLARMERGGGVELEAFVPYSNFPASVLVIVSAVLTWSPPLGKASRLRESGAQ